MQLVSCTFKHSLICYISLYCLIFIASNVDFTAVNGQVVFAIGELTKDITIPILVNTETEDDEIFYVDIATDCCAEITFGQVQVNITENGPDSESKPLILLTFLLHSSIHSYW